MPRWKALPDELDPQVKEFAAQLRRLVDRSGLSVSAVADRTGYSKTSWERYLNGRLLAPKGAIVALAEVTGTHPVHLTTMWELAERAWSRAEMRHDRTMEAIRISQARAALGEFGAAAENQGRGGRAARSTTVAPGIAGPAGVSPTVPPQPTPEQTPDAAGDSGRARGGTAGAGSTGVGSTGGNSWGLAGFKGPSGAGRSPATAHKSGAPAPDSPPAPDAPGPHGPAPSDARPNGGGGSGDAPRRRRPAMFVAGLAGALLVIAAAFHLTGGNDEKAAASKPSATSPSPDADLPPGVKCAGASCTGKDPETMGCGGTQATTSTSVTVGSTLVEVRYSRTCGAAWARITRAAQGDTVEVSAAGATQQTGSVATAGDTDAYTPMVAVKGGAAAKACVTLASGQKGCTK
ncbi:XRE family transcriptional regulator [Streptomyces sp. Ru72]|uniref:XRE family transcriptional regulator n=1 Tax=Streptomyces sp. Ru72 TaxID=2080747 RepID=UPI000CDE4BD0|nr:XRE family transcriptional regulator [Streptomyces sp. Ru72]POX54595.1 hypothetical protein C3488_01550 [Streptomyces sp. Ru72]